jgi:hypothetical protein
VATDLSLLKSFVNGQGAGAATYVTYAEDHDSNYTAIETGYNQLNAEVKAFSGQNAILVQDLFQSTSPAVTVGFVGSESFPTAFLSGDTQFQVGVGTAFTAAEGRVRHNTVDTFTGSGASGNRYFALRVDGSVTQETTVSQGVLDLYRVNWNGSTFDVGTLLRLPTTGTILVDGDDFQNGRIVIADGQTTSAGLPAFTYDRIAHKLDDLNRILIGRSTSVAADAHAINGIAIAGSASAPYIKLGNGTTYRTTTGLFADITAIALGVTVEGTEAVRWDLTTAAQPQTLLRPGTALATPPLAFNTDANTGAGWVSASIWRAIANGKECLRFVGDGSNQTAQFQLASASLPGFSPVGDPDTGIFSPGANRLSFASAGVAGLELNANQQRISATQGRASATHANFTVPNNSVTPVDLTSETGQYDVGNYHDTVTNPDRFTVPTGHDGIFTVHATGSFTANTTGRRGIQITVNGTAIAFARVNAASAGTTDLSVSIDVALVATDIVRMTAFQDSGGNLDINARATVRHVE